mmetsp:Transcript_1372/g.2135  ORF Transcript_1372/g.2135 Transcript_1372/m.2135 type:complete len:348 (-) Transcript_1372:36-1079(-)
MKIAGMDLEGSMPCIVYGLGIIICLGVYGVIQERIMSLPYDGEFFKVSVFLVMCNRIWAVLYATCMAYLKGETFKNQAPLWKYLAISFSNVAASACQYDALKWVSFPVQMLGKSFKMMPVMVLGILISGKQYKSRDWAIALGVTFGVTGFLMTGEISSKHKGKDDSMYGLLLLCGFLLFDGFTSTFQEKLFSEGKGSKYNQMIYVNSGSLIVSFFTVLVSGNMPTAIGFCFAHPLFFFHAMMLSAAAVAGQFFIYSMVKEYGALVFAMTMNLRQVVSILISYSMYGHTINLLQAMGLCVVFGCLFYKSSFSGSKESNANKPVPVPQTEVELSSQPPQPPSQTLGSTH